MGSRVFISHSSQDALAAQRVCKALEAAGIACWIAPRDIPAATSWAQAISDALESSTAIVLLFSATAAASDEVKSELILARQRHLPIVPIRLEAIKPTGDMAFFLAAVQWLDAAGRDIADLLPAIREGVWRSIGHRTTATDEPKPKSNGPEFVREFRGHSDPIEFVALDLNGTTALSASWDLSVRVWDLQSGSCKAIMRGHSGSPTHQGTVYAAAFLEESGKVASAGSDGTVRIWEAGGKGPNRQLPVRPGIIHAMVALPATGHVVIGSSDGSIREWDPLSLREVRAMAPHKASVKSLACDSTGTFGVSCAEDRLVHLIDLGTGRREAEFGSRTLPVAVSMNPEGTLVLVGTSDGKLAMLESPNLKPVIEIQAHKDAIRGLSFLGPDRAITASRDGSLRIWDLSVGLAEWSKPDGSSPINHLAVACESLVVGSADGILRYFRI